MTARLKHKPLYPLLAQTLARRQMSPALRAKFAEALDRSQVDPKSRRKRTHPRRDLQHTLYQRLLFYPEPPATAPELSRNERKAALRLAYWAGVHVPRQVHPDGRRCAWCEAHDYVPPSRLAALPSLPQLPLGLGVVSVFISLDGRNPWRDQRRGLGVSAHYLVGADSHGNPFAISVPRNLLSAEGAYRWTWSTKRSNSLPILNQYRHLALAQVSHFGKKGTPLPQPLPDGCSIGGDYLLYRGVPALPLPEEHQRILVAGQRPLNAEFVNQAAWLPNAAALTAYPHQNRS